MRYGSKTEIMTIYHKGNGALGFYVEDGNKKDNVYINDNTVYLDGNLVLYNNIPETPAEPNSTIYKEEVSLKPYGNKKASDYNKFVASGTSDIALGKRLNQITATALITILSLMPKPLSYVAKFTSLASKILELKSDLPSTEYLGCKYKTYCSGADDYKYIQTFYVNRNCTGAHKTTTTYAHFIIY